MSRGLAFIVLLLSAGCATAPISNRFDGIYDAQASLSQGTDRHCLTTLDQRLEVRGGRFVFAIGYPDWGEPAATQMPGHVRADGSVYGEATTLLPGHPAMLLNGDFADRQMRGWLFSGTCDYHIVFLPVPVGTAMERDTAGAR